MTFTIGLKRQTPRLWSLDTLTLLHGQADMQYDPYPIRILAVF